VGLAWWEIRETAVLARVLSDQIHGLWREVQIPRAGRVDAVALLQNERLLLIEVKRRTRDPTAASARVHHQAEVFTSHLERLVAPDLAATVEVLPILLLTTTPMDDEDSAGGLHQGGVDRDPLVFVLADVDDQRRLRDVVLGGPAEAASRTPYVERQLLMVLRDILGNWSATRVPENPFVLVNSDALGWFAGTRGGASLLDAYETAIPQVLRDRPRRYIAVLHPESLSPNRITIEIASDFSDRDWAALLELQGQLLDRAEWISSQTGLSHPFERVDAVLVPDWSGSRQTKEYS
jgi:hypothetical protein